MNSERGPGGNVPTGKSITVKPQNSQKKPAASGGCC
jgi:hypothetical protein